MQIPFRRYYPAYPHSQVFSSCLITSCLRNEAIQASWILFVSLLYVFVVFLLSFIYLNCHCRSIEHQWPGSSSILMQDCLSLAVWIWASLGQAFEGAEWFVSLNNCWSGASCPCLSPMPYLLASASSCQYHSLGMTQYPTLCNTLRPMCWRWRQIQVDTDIDIDSYITNIRGERIVNMIPMQYVECMTRNPKVL